MNGRVLSVAVYCAVSLFVANVGSAEDTLEDRMRGLLLGSLVGDAAGGPVEFAETDWESDTLLNAPLSDESLRRLGKAFRLRDYPTKAAPYAQWIDKAPRGTITDDSRHKLILLESGRRIGGLTRRGYLQTAIAYFDNDAAPDSHWRRLWLAEYITHFRWLAREEFGVPSSGQPAFPPDRIWGGVPTMAGQMPLLQVACLFPGDPQSAYLTAWDLNILDTGYGKDITSALVAGLAEILGNENGDWSEALLAMRDIDPYDFDKVPWVERQFTRWLNRSIDLGRAGHDSPVSLFTAIDGALQAKTWWEARTPMVITFAILEYTDYAPLPSLELALRFGRDTDSTAQLMGAFLGAKFGTGFIRDDLRRPVEAQLKEQYGETIDRWLFDLRDAR